MKRDPEAIATLWTVSDERWPDEVSRTIRVTRRLKDAQHVAVMPDVHLARGFCVGTALATSRLIYPTAVGSDIGCGMLAMPFRANADAIDARLAERLLTLLPRLVPAHRQREACLSLNRRRGRLSCASLDRVLFRDGVRQLGTLGSGNHFVELQRECDTGRLWLLVHAGSRGLGQAVSASHLRGSAERSRGRPYLDSRSDRGRAYLHDLNACRAYARLNRSVIARACAFALQQLAGIGAEPAGVIHTDHNHVRRERHRGRWLWVHRKGAAPAHLGQISVIPGSMGTPSYHVVGRGHEPALRSSSHGAGRVMDRSAARRRITPDALTRAMGGVWFARSAAAHLTDEAPAAYKNIDQIVRAQADQARVSRKLDPILNYKGR